MYRYRARCTRVVDGDTLDLTIDLGLHVYVVERVRLLGVDTPEIHGVAKASAEYAAGMLAKSWMEQRVMDRELIIETEKDKQGKYGRYLARVWVDDVLLNDQLIAEGLARPY